MANSNNKELTITRIFDAPRELVFKAWTDPKLLAQWWGPKDFTNPVCELDVRPGGRIYIEMTGPDGTPYPMSGNFKEIDEPNRLVFIAKAFEDENGDYNLETLTTVTFADHNGKTKMTMSTNVIKSTPKAAEGVAGMEQGWTESIDRLENLTKKMKTTS